MFMTRRSLARFIPAGLSAWFAPAAVAEPAHSYLDDVRDLLVPGLWMTFAGTTVDAKIEIHHDTECLIVSAWRPGAESLGFTITRESIRDRTYLSEFGPSCRKLRDLIVERPAL